MKSYKSFFNEGEKSSKEVRMRCHRCGSVMVYERFYGLDEQFSGWRCVLCGEIIDHVILENRQTGTGGQTRERRRQGHH
jgi:DNA-directed RNA polymerase subunit RPC12/RpoP